jgi:hypothetical protein
VDRLLEDGSLDDNVDSFLSQDDLDPRETMGRCMDASKGIFLFPPTTFFLSLTLSLSKLIQLPINIHAFSLEMPCAHLGFNKFAIPFF